MKGRYESISIAGETVRAFVPDALPPKLFLSDDLRNLDLRAAAALSRLQLAGEMVPSVEWFLYGFVRKEAVITSQIEGTQATLLDLLEFEASEGVADADVEEVTNYISALHWSRKQLSDPKGVPLSVRLLNGAHQRLMRGVRGQNKHPGHVRKSQNWIGGTRPGNARFVPPPAHLLPDLLSDLEKYIHESGPLPPLVRAGFVHVQFETIHPYLDGNGRIGRLLATLLLEHWELLPQPLLYLSLYFKRHRAEYYERLNAVRQQGDWLGWTRYFLEGVETIANEATETARALFTLFAKDRERVLAHAAATVSAARLFERLPVHPIVTVAKVTTLLSITKPTAMKAIDVLAAAGILSETSARKRDRVFGYQAYLRILAAGTELER